MQKLSPMLQTFFAELVQQVSSITVRAGTVYTQKNKGAKYFYAKYSVGRARRNIFIGPASDPGAQTLADQMRAAQKNARMRRRLIRTLRDNGVPVPTRALGNVLDAMSDAGLFEAAVLVGTAAYVCYSPLLGVILPSSAHMTQDADLETASLVIAGDCETGSMLDLLRRADETFTLIPALKKGAPSSLFKSSEEFLVVLLTPQRQRTDTNPIQLENLRVGVTPIQHLDWLIDEPVLTVALHGPGVPICVPQPSKYAVYKLIVAQKHGQYERIKRGKDLLQAKALIEALSETDPHTLQDALEDAFAKGDSGWKRPALRSLKELEIDLDVLT